MILIRFTKPIMEQILLANKNSRGRSWLNLEGKAQLGLIGLVVAVVRIRTAADRVSRGKRRNDWCVVDGAALSEALRKRKANDHAEPTAEVQAFLAEIPDLTDVVLEFPPTCFEIHGAMTEGGAEPVSNHPDPRMKQ